MIVLFGADGRPRPAKAVPGLFHLFSEGLLPERFRIIGWSPKAFALSDDAFRAHAKDAVTRFGRTPPPDVAWDEFAAALSFGIAEPNDPKGLVAAVEQADAEIGGSPRRLYHLAIPPAAFPSMVEMLGECALSEHARVICEKPFGHDLASAKALNAVIAQHFDETQIFRIDHFLGKESGQHPRAALRERPLRADLEPRPRDLRPDRRARVHLDRGARGVLRTDRAPSATWS